MAQKKAKRIVPPVDKQIRSEKIPRRQPSETQQLIHKLRVHQFQLEKTVSLLRGTLESTADGILVVNNEGKIESFNQRFVELWRIPESIISSRDDNRALAFVLDQLKAPDEFLSKVRELYSDPDAESFDVLEFKDGRFFERYSRPQKIGEKSVGRVWSFRDITERQRAEEALIESEKKFRKLTEAAFEGIAITEKGKFIDLSDRFAMLFGYQRSELIGKNATDVIAPEFCAEAVQKILTGYDKPYESSCLRRDGSTFPVEVCGKNYYSQGRELRITAIRDITKRKQVEQAMKEREKELEVQAKNLEEANVALKVLLQRRDEDKADLEDKVLLNIKGLVTPYLEKLRMSGLDKTQKDYLTILESGLNQITSPFLHRLSFSFANFTPTEIQVANLLKQGKTSKEIGELLNSSSRTIAFHSDNIRKKLGLKNKKTNLKSYLLSLR
jgi:PAS domain S-box-containing protein